MFSTMQASFHRYFCRKINWQQIGLAIKDAHNESCRQAREWLHAHTEPIYITRPAPPGSLCDIQESLVGLKGLTVPHRLGYLGVYVANLPIMLWHTLTHQCPVCYGWLILGEHDECHEEWLDRLSN